MQKYYHYYDKAYEKFTPDWFGEENLAVVNDFLTHNSESIIKFIEKYEDHFEWPSSIFKNKKVLVTGCGLGGVCHYLAQRGARVTGIDVSKLAIMGAQEILQNKDFYIDFKNMDCAEDIDLGESFDFIVDDHLFHCLADQKDRITYLKNLKNHLSDDGLVLIETMAFHSEIQVPVNYRFDDNNILFKDLGDEEIMIRKVASSIDIENEVKNSGFSINYLFFHSELAMNTFPEYEDYPFNFLPKTLRLTFKK